LKSYLNSLRKCANLVSCSSILECIKPSARWKSSILLRIRLTSVRKWRFSSLVCDHLRLYSRTYKCAFSRTGLIAINCKIKSSCWLRRRFNIFVDCSKRSSSVRSLLVSSLKSVICSWSRVVILAHRSLVSDAWKIDIGEMFLCRIYLSNNCFKTISK
jgi:hypothetical protein